MDAYDIFKKLSRGAKFKTKRLLPATDNFVTPKKIKIEENVEDNIKPFILNGNDSDVEIKSEPEDDYDEEIKEKSINEEDEEDDKELVLLGSMTATEKNIKKKKKKVKEMDEEKKKMLEQEQINHFRNINSINTVGKHVPAPIKSFDELEIGKDLKENVKKCGYESPTPIQMQAIPVMLNRRQILACAPTGSGKTAAFLLPILHHLKGPQRKGFRAIIVCPTRELAKQTQRECSRLAGERGFRVHVISKINQALTQYGPKSNQKFDILVTTPNRVCFLLNQEPAVISLANVEWLVIDEADKLFEEGLRGFRDQLNQIMKACTSTELRIAMFSATQTVDVGRWCKKNMKNMINVTIGSRNSATDLVDQELLFVGNESGKLVAFRNIVHKGLHPPVLVFVQSKDRAQQLFQELIYDGINVDVIHADRTQLQRDNTVRSFREGKIWVLICTELMARGIDFKGVNLVINYDFPPSAITYIHRIGRAGRAGRKGKAITFFTTDDTPNLRSIAHVLRQSGCEVPDFMLTMKKKRNNKKEKNKIIPRVDISTKPNYVKEKYKKKKERQMNSGEKNNSNDAKVEFKNKNQPTFNSGNFQDKNKFNKKKNDKLKINKNKVGNKKEGNKKGSFKEKLKQQGLDNKSKKKFEKVVSTKLNTKNKLKKVVKNKE